MPKPVNRDRILLMAYDNKVWLLYCYFLFGANLVIIWHSFIQFLFISFIHLLFPIPTCNDNIFSQSTHARLPSITMYYHAYKCSTITYHHIYLQSTSLMTVEVDDANYFCDIFQEVGKALSRRSNTPDIHKKCYNSILITLINHHNIKLNCKVCSIHSFTFWCLKHKHRKLGIYASFQMVYGFSLHIKTSLVGWSSKTVR